jgi:hypothetical protein
MHSGERRMSATLLTVEMRPEREGTLLVLTDQSVYFGAGEVPTHRRAGWGEILDRLARYFASGNSRPGAS